jgi:hypothetical protein
MRYSKAMLERLHLKNVGPAPELEMNFAPRLNIITGDNGLGKSFLLDVAWSSVTEDWFQDPYAQNNSGADAEIDISLHGQIKYRVTFDFSYRVWLRDSGISDDSGILVFHQKADSSFAFADTVRTPRSNKAEWRWQQHFSNDEIWNGLEEEKKVVCNGIIRDWGFWQLENGAAFKQLKAALDVLSASTEERLEPGKLTRVSLNDAREIPTLKMPYGQEVPITIVSSAIKRVISLAYMLVWGWQEHLKIAKLRKKKPSRNIVILIDEVEQHLHPRWQKAILNSLLNVAQTIMDQNDVRVQIVCTTHSPLVMASLEPLFDEKQDAWFDLNLVNDEVKLERMPWRKRGGAGAWLISEAFDLPSDENTQANAVLEKAAKAYDNPKLSKKKFLELDAELRATLAESHPFWVRWQFWGEKKGWL